MALYDKTKEVEVLGEISPGFNFITIKIDFNKVPAKATDDDWKVFVLNNNWVLLNGYTQIPVASTSLGTIDIGTAQDGTELDTAIDISTGATGMTAMDTLLYNAAIVITADGYIYLRFNTAPVLDGVLEIHLEILAAPTEDSRTD